MDLGENLNSVVEIVVLDQLVTNDDGLQKINPVSYAQSFLNLNELSDAGRDGNCDCAKIWTITDRRRKRPPYQIAIVLKILSS